MERPNFKPYHTLFLLFLFWCMWLYSEVTEYHDRKAHRTEVDNFMNRGDRFTREMGEDLEARIQALESQEDVDLVKE